MSGFTSIAPTSHYKYAYRKQCWFVFDGTAGKGAVGTAPFFTVGQALIVRDIFFVIETPLTGATATISAGVTGAATQFNAATTATTLDGSKQLWLSGALASIGAQPAGSQNYLVDAFAASFIFTIGTAAVTGGALNVTVVYDTVSPQNGDSSGILTAVNSLI